MEKTNYEPIKVKLLTLPTSIKNQELDLLEINKEIDKINLEKKRILRKVYAIVSQETETVVDAKGVSKTTKKYTNEAQRDAEVEERLAPDSAYIQLMIDEQLQQQLAKLASIEKDFLERELRSTGHLVKILELER